MLGDQLLTLCDFLTCTGLQVPVAATDLFILLFFVILGLKVIIILSLATKSVLAIFLTITCQSMIRTCIIFKLSSVTLLFQWDTLILALAQ